LSGVGIGVRVAVGGAERPRCGGDVVVLEASSRELSLHDEWVAPSKWSVLRVDSARDFRAGCQEFLELQPWPLLLHFKPGT
jgi:hypothetical protein